MSGRFAISRLGHKGQQWREEATAERIQGAAGEKLAPNANRRTIRRPSGGLQSPRCEGEQRSPSRGRAVRCHRIGFTPFGERDWTSAGPRRGAGTRRSNPQGVTECQSHGRRCRGILLGMIGARDGGTLTPPLVRTAFARLRVRPSGAAGRPLQFRARPCPCTARSDR